jgi:protein phosphatase-4 regulatory subunit 3
MEVLKLLIENNPEEPNDAMDLFLVHFYPRMAASISHQVSKEKKMQFVEISLGLARALKP